MFASRKTLTTAPAGGGGGGFDPLDLSPTLWLDASDSTTLYDATTGGSLVAADGAIARWEDKSGNAHHATQATGVNKPLRKTSVQNSLDSVRFDGANDHLVHTADMDVGTIFVVYNPISFGASYRGVISLGTSGATGCMLLGRTFSGGWGTYTTTDVNATSPAATGVVLHVLKTTGSGNSISFYRNGSPDGTATGDPVGQTSKHVGGETGVAEQSLNMDCLEILVFPTALSDTDRGDVETYLNSKWAIY